MTSIYTPTEELPVKQNMFTVCINETIKKGDGWEAYCLALTDLDNDLTQHEEIIDKRTGPAFFPGVLIDGKRNNNAVSEIHLMVFDLDDGSPIEPTINRLKEVGLHGIIYSTHSHMTTTTNVKLSNYENRIGSVNPTEDGIREYLGQLKKLTPQHISTATVGDVINDEIAITHDPVPKYRIILPMVNPFQTKDFTDLKLAKRTWEAKYKAVADHLGLRFDDACDDLARAFFIPAAAPGSERFTKVIEGKLLDLNDFPVELPKLPVRPIRARATANAGETVKDKASQLRKLRISLQRWIAKHGTTFNIEDALRAHAPSDIFRNPRADQPGVHITCPFEETHTEAGGTGTFVVNASENGDIGMGIHCCHAHCSRDRGHGNCVDRVSFLLQMLLLGWLPAEALRNPEFGGGPFKKVPSRTDFLVIDADNVGLDAGQFHASIIQNGLLDFTKLNAITPEPLSETCTPEDLADFIELKWITVAMLRRSIKDTEPETLSTDYEKDIYRIAKSIRTDNLSKFEIKQALDKIVRVHDTNIKIVKRDLEEMQDRFASLSDRHLGIMPWYEVRKVHGVANYTLKYARLLQSGKPYILDMKEETLSSALMTARDFKEFMRSDYFDFIDSAGRKKTFYPADDFVDKPPVDTRVFDKGLVFKPSGTIRPGEWNLFKGFSIKPDPSGSCSLVYELLNDVWCQGDPQLFQYVCEWLMHIPAFPGEKTGTALIIRGEQGDGKSIIFDQFMGSFLGPMMLKSANDDIILGHFNEAMAGKLLVVLEEAAFAGDKKKFELLKETITGPTISINAKYKSIATIDNHARMVLITNNDHAGYIQAGDRRYTVIETVSAWSGTNKFDALVDQLKNGGAAKFLHDALNHNFRTLEGTTQLVIGKALMTKAKAEQISLSRTPLEDYVVHVLMTGDFVPCEKNGYTDEGDELDYSYWEVDTECSIASSNLVICAERYMSKKMVYSRQKLNPSIVIKRFEKYIGRTEKHRSKGPMANGTRDNNPVERILPPRQQAIEYAYKKGLLNEEEYITALPPSPQLQVKSTITSRIRLVK